MDGPKRSREVDSEFSVHTGLELRKASRRRLFSVQKARFTL
jgi:hypothetical protein